MKNLFGEEVEIVPSAPGLEPKHELKSLKAKKNADHLFGKYYVVVPVHSMPIDFDTLKTVTTDEVKITDKAGRKTRSDSELLTASWDQSGNLWKRTEIHAQKCSPGSTPAPGEHKCEGQQLNYSPELIKKHARLEASRKGRGITRGRTPTTGQLSERRNHENERHAEEWVADTEGWAMARTPPGASAGCTPAPATPLPIERSATALRAVTGHTTSCGRRTTYITPQATTMESPAGAASCLIADGHSGVDHPPGIDKVEPGKVPLHPTTVPSRPRLSKEGCSGVLPTPSVPTHISCLVVGGTSLRSKTPLPEAREHGKQEAGTVKYDGYIAISPNEPEADPKTPEAQSSSDQHPRRGLQPAPIESTPSSHGSVAGQERSGQKSDRGLMKRLDFEGSCTPAEPSDHEPEPQPDQETAEEGGKSHRDAPVCPLTIDYESNHVDTPLHAVPASVSWKDESHPSWVKIRTVMDSGAAQSVAPQQWPLG